MAKILFVQDYPDELIGISSISSYVKPRHGVSISMGNLESIKEKIRAEKPDVVGISALTINHAWALSVASLVKSIDQRLIVLLGGPHPTFYPEIIHDTHVDMICMGEGERPVLELLDKLDAKKNIGGIPSLWIKRGRDIVKNPVGPILAGDDIPMRDVNLYDEFPLIKKADTIIMGASRGCPFHCNFCGNYALLRMYSGIRYFRHRKIEDIMREIELYRGKRAIRVIKFQDDIFGVDPKWLEEFAAVYKKRVNLPFYCMLRCEYTTEKNVRLLKDAGCFRVGIGVESGDEGIRNATLGKNLKDTTITQAVKILRSHGIKFHTFNMFCLPGETLREAYKTVDFNLQLNPSVVWSAIFQPYPGTKFFSDSVKQTMLDSKFDRFNINYNETADARKIWRLQKLFMFVTKFRFFRFLLPVLVELNLDNFYDSLSKWTWDRFYKIKNGE
jgi:anaerobic magnesium-protoporphyrin IX monomethyl ester cyclase